jgi:hypothetical protein
MEDRTCPNCHLFCHYPSKLKIHFENSYHCKKTVDEINTYFLSIERTVDIKCSDCNKGFSRKDSLQRHIENSKCSKSKIDLQEDTINISKDKLQSLIKEEAQKLLNNNNTIPITNLESNNDDNDNDITHFNYVYLIEKFNVNNKEYIYKFGKTNREYSKRLKEHGDEAKLLLILDVVNCNAIEKKILNILRNTVNIKQCDFGNEYFLCNDKEYIKTIILKNI